MSEAGVCPKRMVGWRKEWRRGGPPNKRPINRVHGGANVSWPLSPFHPYTQTCMRIIDRRLFDGPLSPLCVRSYMPPFFYVNEMKERAADKLSPCAPCPRLRVLHSPLVFLTPPPSKFDMRFQLGGGEKEAGETEGTE